MADLSSPSRPNATSTPRRQDGPYPGIAPHPTWLRIHGLPRTTWAGRKGQRSRYSRHPY